MRTEQELKARVRELVAQELNHRITEAGRRLPSYCLHHFDHTLDSRKTVDGFPNPDYNRITTHLSVIGLCNLGVEDPESWNGTICDEEIDAKKCPKFQSIKKKSDIIAELESDLKNPVWLKENMPELSTLVWVLSSVELRVPLWRRVLMFLRVIRVEPKAPSFDPSILM